MKVLVIGNGGREHAIIWKFAQSKRLSGLYCLPGNAGTAKLGQNITDISMVDTDQIRKLVLDLGIDLVFVGPEAPLAKGLVDILLKENIKVIGPHQYPAQLESSKVFSKRFLKAHGVATAEAEVFENYQEAEAFLQARPGKPWVIKKSGLASGKGVLESDNTQELLAFAKEQMSDGDSILVEEYLRGYEVSIFTISDGFSYKLLPSAADYKKAKEGNTGLNTGGMGAISPVPWLEKSVLKQIEEELVIPTFKGLEKENLMYKGILYFGIMVTQEGPKVLEFNVRFGDPEAQVLIPLIQNDFCDLWEAVALGKLASLDLKLSNESALGVVLAAPGYPGPYPKDLEVHCNCNDHDQKRFVFHASTYQDGTKTRTNGGRCFTMVGLGKDPLEAREKAYSLAAQVQFEGAWFRSDIGANVYSQKY